MAIQPVPYIAPAPVPGPQRGDEATFDDRMDAKIRWDETSAQQFYALGQNVQNNATEAMSYASASQTAANNAATYRDAAMGYRDAAQGYASTAMTYRDAAQGYSVTAMGYRDQAAASAALAATYIAAQSSTSATSQAIGTGNFTFTTQANKAFVAGADVKVVDQANSGNAMFGTVASYSGTTLQVSITRVTGSGTIAAWNLIMIGERGQQGIQGPVGGVNGGNLLGLLAELKAANITAAATTNVWATVGNSATLIGGTAVTSFGTAPQAGAKFTLIAGAATPLTNGANLALPGGLNYTTAVGDRLEIYADTTTAMQVSIFKKDGTAVFGNQYLKVSERQASGVNAGTSVGNDITQTRTINTTEVNSIPGAFVSLNQVVLPAGTYKYRIRVPAGGGVNAHRAFLYNVTDATYTGVGSSVQALPISGAAANWDSWVSGRFTIAAQKSFSIRYFDNTSLVNTGLGIAASGSGISGQPEIYTEAEFEKVN